jgi:hypothetical protein
MSFAACSINATPTKSPGAGQQMRPPVLGYGLRCRVPVGAAVRFCADSHTGASDTRTMQKTNREHALVLGGSIAGLLAARVLADRYDSVTIVDRDRLPSGAAHRPGSPQSHHVHAILPRGVQIIEDLMPGLTRRVVATSSATSAGICRAARCDVPTPA